MYKIGNKVKIIRKYENKYPHYWWVPEMDLTLNKYGTIVGIDNDEKVYLVSFENMKRRFWFSDKSFDKNRKEKFERIINKEL